MRGGVARGIGGRKKRERGRERGRGGGKKGEG